MILYDLIRDPLQPMSVAATATCTGQAFVASQIIGALLHRYTGIIRREATREQGAAGHGGWADAKIVVIGPVAEEAIYRGAIMPGVARTAATVACGVLVGWRRSRRVGLIHSTLAACLIAVHRALPMWAAVWASALLFAGVHAVNQECATTRQRAQSIIQLQRVPIAIVFTATAVTHGLAASMLLHATYNLGVVLAGRIIAWMDERLTVERADTVRP